METSEAQLIPCLDCGTPLRGPYCSHCGQRRQDRDLRLKHVLTEVIQNLFLLDDRILGSLRLLIFRPGQLTLEYFAGRRARFLSPFRLYVFVSFLLFLLLGFSGVETHTTHRGKSGIVVQVDEEGAAPADPVKKKPGRFKRGILKASENPEAFKEALLPWISRVMFLLLPAFAGLLFLLYLGSGTYFVEHVIFSLHFHAFAFSLFILQKGLAMVPSGWARFLGGLLTLALPVHLCLALKRVHGGSTWKRHLKGIVLSGLYLVLVGVALAGVVVWVLMRA